MKKLLFGLLVLLAPFTIVLGVLECVFPEQKFSLHEKKAQTLMRASSVDIAIFGNSHTAEGVIPSRVSAQSFNLAHPSQTLNYDLELFRHLIKIGKKPKVAVVCVSRFNIFHKPITETAGKWTCYRYHRSFGIPYLDWKLYVDCRSWSAFFCYRRFYGVKDWLTGGNKVPEIDQNGGLTVFDGWDLSFGRLSNDVKDEQAEARALNHWSNMSLDARAKNMEVLTTFAEEARLQGVTLVMITLPVSNSYRNSKTAKLYFDQAGDVLSEFSEKHNIIWYDMQDDIRFIDALFRNSDHLNKSGAELASDLIHDKVMNLDNE